MVSIAAIESLTGPGSLGSMSYYVKSCMSSRVMIFWTKFESLVSFCRKSSLKPKVQPNAADVCASSNVNATHPRSFRYHWGIACAIRDLS